MSIILGTPPPPSIYLFLPRPWAIGATHVVTIRAGEGADPAATDIARAIVDAINAAPE